MVDPVRTCIDAMSALSLDDSRAETEVSDGRNPKLPPGFPQTLDCVYEDGRPLRKTSENTSYVVFSDEDGIVRKGVQKKIKSALPHSL
jgi:hypothetical protein